MNRLRKYKITNKPGAALIVSMIFVFIFAVLSLALSSMSGANAQIAKNQQKANRALASAESGSDIIRFWLSRVRLSGIITPADQFLQIAAALKNDLTNSGISNIKPISFRFHMIIPPVALDSAAAQSFQARIYQIDPNNMRVDVVGFSGQIKRTIRTIYKVERGANTVFDFGVATRGPLYLAGDIELEGVNVSVEASVFIESESDDLALRIEGNSQIAGNVSIANTDAYVEIQGDQASIGGDTAPEALDHVFIGIAPPEFPTPDPHYFEHYVTNVVTSGSSSGAVLENARIAAGTNPTFSGSTTIKGILYIEHPNVVTFAGNCNITGIIVADGDVDAPSAANQLVFQGSVSSYSVTTLPAEAKFEGIRQEEGTFLMAPGFSASFGGNFGTLNGAIAANGITFSGNAGGTIAGSVINYSDVPMTLSGNNDLKFNRSGITKVPAGFIPQLILTYDSDSYSEVIL